MINKELLNFIKDENVSEFKDTFENELKTRIFNKIEDLTPEIAQNIFGFLKKEDENEDI